MGEAASKVTEETRVSFPSLDIVWTTVNDDLPVVISALESALRREDQSEAPDR
jgi:uncharacterized protein with HEPN domain